MVVYVTNSALRGKVKAPANPWGGSTLEWDTASPPPLYNFEEHEPPTLRPLYEYDDMELDEASGGYIRKSEKPA